MLLPDPAVLIVQAGSLVIIAYILIDRWRARRRIKARIDPFSSDNPSGMPTSVLEPRAQIVYRGAILAMVIFLLVTVYALAVGFHEWGPNDVDRWTDPDHLLGAGMMVLFLLIVPACFIQGSPREFFLVSDAGLVLIRGREETCILWKDVTSLKAVPQGKPLMVRFSSSRDHIDAHLLIRDVERLYEVAVRRLPPGVRDNDAYRWMVSQVASKKVSGSVPRYPDRP